MIFLSPWLIFFYLFCACFFFALFICFCLLFMHLSLIVFYSSDDVLNTIHLFFFVLSHFIFRWCFIFICLCVFFMLKFFKWFFFPTWFLSSAFLHFISPHANISFTTSHVVDCFHLHFPNTFLILSLKSRCYMCESFIYLC